jgi:hypothetical protein
VSSDEHLLMRGMRATWLRSICASAAVAVALAAPTGARAQMATAATARAVTGAGPYDVALFTVPATASARGSARLVFAPSPFGVAVSADGHARYDVRVNVSGLPFPSTLGAYTTYVAWAATADLKTWLRIGTITNGDNLVGPVELNKFLLVITAEVSPTPLRHAGPTVLHGTSPSGWLQSLLSHPLFRGITG